MKIIKKIAILLSLSFLVVIAMSACQTNKNSSSSNKVVKVKHGKQNKKTLIVYFSLTGTTKKAAQQIQKATGADLIRLEPQRSYGSYDNAAKRGDRERKENIHPALATKIPHFSSYQTVFVGYPTW
jgi:outer membrane protein assembly factor BamE (lipoprotein component of BamABCDE complex)